MRLVNVGYGNMANSSRIIAIVSPDSAPVRRMIQDAKDSGRAIDATCGHKTRAVLIMDSNHIVLSPLQTETMAARAEEKGKGSSQNTPAESPG